MQLSFYNNRNGVCALTAALLLAWNPVGAEEKSSCAVIKASNYSFSLDPQDNKSSNADRERKNLSDGIKSGSEARSIWTVRELQNKPLEIKFSFTASVNLKSVKIYYFRWVKGYGIKQITVYGLTPDGEKNIMGGIRPDQPYELPSGEPNYALFDIALDSSNAVSEVIIQIAGTSYIGLTEVEFCGFPAKSAMRQPSESVPNDNPFECLKKNISLEPTLKLFRQDVNHDGVEDIILENGQMLYVIDAGCGAVVNYAYDKHSKVNLVKPRSRNNWGGVFADSLWPSPQKELNMPDANQKEWNTAIYNSEIIENTPDRIKVKLSRQGVGGMFQWLSFEKVYTLEKDSAALRADYRFINGKDNVVPVNYGVWLQAGLGSETEPFKIFYSSAIGAISHKIDKELWNYGPVRGWAGIVTDSGRGCAVVNDFKYMLCDYFWSDSSKYTTLECKYNRYPVKAGESFDFTTWFVPFYGIGVPASVTPAMTGAFELGKRYLLKNFPPEFNIMLKPSAPGKYAIKSEVKRLPDEKWETLSFITCELPPVPSASALKFSPVQGGTYLLRVSVFEFGREIFNMEHMIILDKSSGDYVMSALPKMPVPGQEGKEKRDLNYNSTEYVTPHVKWAKPFAPGSPKVLFLSLKRGGIREAVELAERFDMEFDTSYIAGFTSRALYDLGAYYAMLNSSDCLAELQKMLQNNKYDCFVISSNLWKYLNEGIKDNILRKVNAGAGLVLLEPLYLPGPLAADFSLPLKPEIVKGRWDVRKSHPVTDGIPFDALPETLALKYSTQGDVLASVCGQPLVSIWNYGRGRVAAAAWYVESRDRTGYYAENSARTFLPNLLYAGNGDCSFNYWEYQLSLLAKMIYWTAGKDFRICGTKMNASNNKLEFELISKKSHLEAIIELTIRDKFYKIETVKEITVKLNEGPNSIEIPFAAPTLTGIHFADVIVRNGKATEWWGSVAFKTGADSIIQNITAEKSIWKRGEDFRCTVLASGNKKNIKLFLIDSCGRIFAESSKPVTDKEIQFTFALKGCAGIEFKAVARILDGTQVIDEKSAGFIIYESPDARKLQVAFGWPTISLEGTQEFLMKPYWAILKELGATAVKVFKSDMQSEVDTARELNLPLLCSPSVITTGGKFPATTKAEMGKFGLIRTPCLSKPGFQDELEKGNAAISLQEKYGVLYRSGPDEANSINVWDGCFSADCQSEFRNWLKIQYGTLEKLNLEWETSFSSWDQVIAMDGKEAKGRNSFAPWHDHRTFNEWNWQRSLESIVRGMKKADPALRYSLSGTMETNAFNAWDWVRMMKVLSAVEGYGGEQTVEQRSFKQEKFLWLTWIGYNADEQLLTWQIFDSLFQGATGFCIFNGKFYVNPDFSLPRGAIALKNSLRKVGQGIAETIINAEYEACPIAFHYSPASIKTDWMLNMDQAYYAEVKGVKTLLSDIGADYDYISYLQLENSDILNRKYKILYLPLSSSLSAAEVEVVRAFVKNGGILIADMLSGEYSVHGRGLKAHPLDDVFGIDSTDSKVESCDALINGLPDGGIINIRGLNVPVKYFAKGVKCASANPAAEVQFKGKSYPAMLVNRFGKGIALYTASDIFSTYGNWKEMRYFNKNMPQTSIIAGIIKSLFQAAAIKTGITPVTEDGSLLVATKCYLRKNSQVYIAGLIRDYSISQNIDNKIHDVRVKLFDTFHCYDMLEGKYLGQTDSLKCKIGPFTHKVLALLPYKVEALNITGPDCAAAGSQLAFNILVKTSYAKPAMHTFYIEVFAPDGKKEDAYSGIQFADSGRYDLLIPLPLNAAQGKWRITVVDVLTGTRANAYFNVVAE